MGGFSSRSFPRLERHKRTHRAQYFCCGMLLSSGRALPALPNILASHALVHTAEGEFFRKVVRQACEHYHIPVLGIRERELDDRANAAIGTTAARVRQHISSFGKTVGSPWTQDELRSRD
jgi:hypothetical protein